MNSRLPAVCDAGGGVGAGAIPALIVGWVLLPRGDDHRATRKGDILPVGVILQLTIPIPCSAGLDVPVGRIQRCAVELVAPNEIRVGSMRRGRGH